MNSEVTKNYRMPLWIKMKVTFKCQTLNYCSNCSTLFSRLFFVVVVFIINFNHFSSLSLIMCRDKKCMNSSIFSPPLSDIKKEMFNQNHSRLCWFSSVDNANYWAMANTSFAQNIAQTICYNKNPFYFVDYSSRVLKWTPSLRQKRERHKK